jgi:hypothetical protein
MHDQNSRKAGRVLLVRKRGGHLISAFDAEGKCIWSERCDHLRRLIVIHRRLYNSRAGLLYREMSNSKPYEASRVYGRNASI